MSAVVQDKQQQPPFCPLKSYTRDYLDEIEHRLNGERRHLDSPFSGFDRDFQGWLHQGLLIVVAARHRLMGLRFCKRATRTAGTFHKGANLFWGLNTLQIKTLYYKMQG